MRRIGQAGAAALATAALSLSGGCSDGTAPGRAAGEHSARAPSAAKETPPGAEAATAPGAVRATFAAYTAKDIPRWLGSWSDAGFLKAFGVAKAEAAKVPPSWGNIRSFRESVVTLRGISEEKIGKDRGTVIVETGESGVVTWHRLDLVVVAGRWRLAGRTAVPAPATDLPAVEVVLSDASISLGGAMVGGNANLHVVNNGSTPHELVLLRGRGGVDETVGRIVPLAPGSASTMVIRDLPAGDYSAVCNLLDAEGTPHSAIGMRAVFHVS